ncbi:DUF1772 domain-containing protein [Lewinella sp. W8]|uniref:DUF1772 domain-containing protein n=1 Tax=Lewinella sp. W8 TaxID=2528208 RepID=UPI001068BAD0|nr:DUF1772 domain-containing protein [Lewinella sp. W8]MTB52092.1 DUF1772 domain-containing protein [Lewinella sp. W8]
MKHFLLYSSLTVYSIFLGSQITEGVLLVTYWKSLSANDFHAYYRQFGPGIGQFYTILTVMAVLMPVAVSVYAARRFPTALKYSLLSSFFALLVIVSFYVYFRGTNELFYAATLTEVELREELIRWGKWHWGRVAFEILSLLFLVLSLTALTGETTKGVPLTQ